MTMQIFTWAQITAAREGAQRLFEKSAALTVGNFDGPHAGHISLFKMVKGAASSRGLLAGAVTFTRSLGAFKSRGLPPISTLSQRLKSFEENGMDFATVIDFSDEFSKIEGAAFFDTLVRACRMNYFAEGEDFRFGWRGSCGMAEIRTLCKERDVVCEFAPPVMYENRRVSSSLIREKIFAGDFSAAAKMLGKNYALDCTDIFWQMVDSALVAERGDFVQALPPNGAYTVKATTSEGSAGSRLFVEPQTLRLENVGVGHIQSVEFMPAQTGAVANYV